MKLVLSIYIGVALVVLSSAVQAQVSTAPSLGAGVFHFFATEFGDFHSAGLFNQIFGPLFPAAHGGTAATPFSILIGFVNLVLLSVGGVLLAYNITAGLLQSAHEGTFLGRRWSSLWAPLRVLFAVTLLIPIPGLGGYNVIQGGVAWITRGATLLASELWSEGSQLVLSGEIPLVGTAPKLDTALMGTVYRNQLCLRLANYQFEIAGSSSRVRFVVEDVDGVPVIMSSIDGRRPEICGSYHLPETPAYISRLGPAGAAIEGEFRRLHADMLHELIQAADQIIVRQWPLLIANDGELPPISDDISAAVAAANSRLSTGNSALFAAISSSVNESDQARMRLMQQMSGVGCHETGSSGGSSCAAGWIAAGNWHILIARLNAEMMGILNASSLAVQSRYLESGVAQFNRQLVITADEPGWLQRVLGGVDSGKYLHLDEAARIWRVATRHYERAAVRVNGMVSRISGDILQDSAPVGPPGLLGRIWQVGFADSLNGLIDILSPANWADDPMVGIVSMGNWYLDVVGALIFGGAAVSLLTGGFGSAVVFLIAAPLTAIGVTLSFLLPALPFLFWILAVFGYVLLVLEAVVAASLWALAHMRLDGEGISGDAGRYGWLALLSLMLTPTMMVLGFFAGMVLFRVIARLFDSGVYLAMGSLATASPVVAIFGLIAAGVLIVFAYMVILERSFSLISTFPQRLLRWIGGDAPLSDGIAEGRFQTGLRTVAASLGSGAVKAGQASGQGLRSMTTTFRR